MNGLLKAYNAVLGFGAYVGRAVTGTSKTARAARAVGRTSAISLEVLTVGMSGYALATEDWENPDWDHAGAEMLFGLLSSYSLFRTTKKFSRSKVQRDTAEVFSKSSKVSKGSADFLKSPVSNKFVGFDVVDDTNINMLLNTGRGISAIKISKLSDGIRIGSRTIKIDKSTLAYFKTGLLISSIPLAMIYHLLDEDSQGKPEQKESFLQECQLHLDRWFDHARNAYDTIYHYDSRGLPSALSRAAAMIEGAQLERNAMRAQELVIMVEKLSSTAGRIFPKLASTMKEHLHGYVNANPDDASKALLAEAFPSGPEAVEKEWERTIAAPVIDQDDKSPKEKAPTVAQNNTSYGPNLDNVGNEDSDDFAGNLIPHA